MHESNNVKDIIYTVTPVVRYFIKRLKYAVSSRIYRCMFGNTCSDNIKVHKITQFYQNRVNDIFLDSSNMVDNINNIIDSYITRILDKISKYKDTPNNDKIQEKTFQQIIYFLNSLCLNELSIKYFNISLSINNLKDFENKTIGEKIYSVLPTGNGNAGCCWHLSMILKHFFDILESKGLEISSYLFVEKRKFDNHTGVIVEFHGKIYLIDPYINIKFLTPISDLGQDIQKRMAQVTSNINKSKDLNSIIKRYTENNEEFFKVIVEYKDLVHVLKSIPHQTGYIRLYGDLLDILGYRLRPQFFKNGILISNDFFYEFDNGFNQDVREKSPDDVISYLFANITHKFDINHKKIISVSKLERWYLVEQLRRYQKSIDFLRLREILLGNNEYHPK